MVNAESSSSQNQNASSYPYKNNNVNILSNLDSTHGYVDLKCIKGKSLRERFHELLSSSSSTSSVSIKYELDNRIDRFKEACLQLIGKDSISLKELGTSAIFILLGDMGDQFVELISRSVSVVDIPRHCSLKQFKPKILCKIGASGAVNVDLAWIDVCKCLGSLLAYHPFKTVDREQFSELFRQCRVVSQNEELILKLVNNNYNSTSSSHKQRKAFHRSTSSKKNPGEKRNGSVEKQEDGCSYALQEDDVTDPFR
ncbi:unnamed protein product [Trichobilharzia regenti]|nr:unnamed protein product [Trichobilharzia regenti]